MQKGIDSMTFSFKFNAKKAEERPKRIGETNFPIPAQFDGAKVTANVPALAVFTYGRNPAAPLGAEAGRVLVVEGKSPTVTLEGTVIPEEFRDFMLGMPGLPSGTVNQLRALSDWKGTLPVPVPRDLAYSEDLNVNGSKALMVMHGAGKGGVVMWQQDGVFYLVAGELPREQLITVAESLNR